jgi:hypothetical protein
MGPFHIKVGITLKRASPSGTVKTIVSLLMLLSLG